MDKTETFQPHRIYHIRYDNFQHQIMFFVVLFCRIFHSLMQMEGVNKILSQLNDMLKIPLQKESFKIQCGNTF